MTGLLDAAMELMKYTPACIRRNMFPRRHTFIFTIIVLIGVSVIMLSAFQTNLKTNREHIENVSKLRDITGSEGFDSLPVQLRQDNIDRNVKLIHKRNLMENKAPVYKGKDTDKASPEQASSNEVNTEKGENQLKFKNRQNLSELKKRADKMLVDNDSIDDNRETVDKEVIPDETNNKKLTFKSSRLGEQKKLSETMLDGDDREIIPNSDKDEMTRKENNADQEQEALIETLSQLLAKLDENGVDTDLKKIMSEKSETKNDKHLPKFDPALYPQKLDIPKLLRDVAETGEFPGHQINKWKYQPVINPSNACENSNVKSKVFLLFIVKTKTDNFLKRKSIRKTWGDQVRFPNIRTVFSVGLPKSSHTMKKLKLESVTYKDILLMDYMDTYYNLTLKTTSGINWAVAHCSSAEFVVSVDDDMYVATDFLLKHLEDLPQKQADRLYLGHVYENTAPVREHNYDEYTQKWIVDEEEYAFRTYPDYVFGGFIVMSMRTVVEIYTIIPYTKPIAMEDVYVGILASRLGIVPTDTDLVDVYVTYSNSEKFKSLLASHFYKSSSMLKKTWECHLSLTTKDVEKAVFCTFLKEELESLREHISNMLDWIEMSNSAV
ncbi:uncharacterized protein [Argopecten irradians]|uniref:uncharacterized protein n=1 Tax=Argopecten irradians TaxID=31199 RepID=UPI003723A510